MTTDPRHHAIMAALEDASHHLMTMRVSNPIAEYWRFSNNIRRYQLMARARESIMANWHPQAIPGTSMWNQYCSRLSSWAQETLRIAIGQQMSSGDSPAMSDNECPRSVVESTKQRRCRDDGDDDVFNLSP